jgi:hypothetical protein
MKAAGFNDKLSNSGASCCRCHFFVQCSIGFDENEKISNKQKKNRSNRLNKDIDS